METESATTSEDLHRRRHSHSNHSRHSSGGNNNNNNNNNNINININSHQVEPDLSSEDGDFGSADEIGSEEASAWIARASRSLCEDSQGAAGVGGGLVDGGLGVGVGAEDGSSPPLQGEVNVTLWQFLLELLMSRQYSHVIQWTNREGEFQLLRAEEVARLWGMRKNKNHRMNYDKLSRALRYYYQKNIIKKVQGQKFVYRFVGLSESALRASRTLGAAAAAAAIAAPPDGVCSPKLEAVEDDSPATPPLEEPSTPQAQPLLLQQTQPQTPPHQPAALAQARRLWQGGQLLQHQHHHQPHQQQHQQQHQGLDLSLPHAAAAAVAAVAAAAAAASPASVSAGAAALSSSSPPFSKRHRTPEAAIRSPESPPAKRPCCSCRCHEPQPQLQTSPLNAAVSTPRVKSEPTTVASAMEPGESLDTDGGGGDLPGNYIQWLTLELAGSGGAGSGGPAYLHSTRHAANMKKLAEHIRLHKLLKRPEPAAISAPTSSATSAAAAAAAAAAASHSLRHPHPPPPPHASGLASSMGNGSPFSPPGCVWMPVPVAMLSQLWAGHEAAAAAVAAASAAAAAAAAAAAPSSSSSGGGAGDIEDQGD